MRPGLHERPPATLRPTQSREALHLVCLPLNLTTGGELDSLIEGSQDQVMFTEQPR